MRIKRSIYNYNDTTIGANKKIFAVVAFKDEKDEKEDIKHFKIDPFIKEEYEVVKTEFKETENIFYVRRLDSDLPILPKYLEPHTMWFPGLDMTKIMSKASFVSNSYRGLNEPILKELEILNNGNN